ncbi:MAG TPA: sporulation protein YqfD [Bacilli bacterium]
MKEYKVYTSSANLSKINKKNISHLRKNNERISFYTDEKSLKKLLEELEDIEYYNVIHKKVRYILRKHLITIISLFIIVILLINQSISVREIRFINYNTYNEDVEEFLMQKLKKRGPFYYLNDDLNDINHELKTIFYQYEWISVKKNGAYLEVDIKKLDKFDEPDADDGTPGDYFASKDAIIKLYHVKKGVVLIRESQSVSKGDLLITGNLKYWIDGEEYIRPKGIVIGEVLEYQEVKVKKKKELEMKTGKIESKNVISLFGYQFKRSPSFQNYEEKEKVKFNLSNVITFKKMYFYQKDIITITYTKEEAIAYAKSLIEKDFNPGLHEEIKFIELLETIEDKEYYHFRFIVKKYENIAQFVPRA